MWATILERSVRRVLAPHDRGPYANWGVEQQGRLGDVALKDEAELLAALQFRDLGSKLGAEGSLGHKLDKLLDSRHPNAPSWR